MPDCSRIHVDAYSMIQPERKRCTIVIEDGEFLREEDGDLFRVGRASEMTDFHLNDRHAQISFQE